MASNPSTSTITLVDDDVQNRLNVLKEHSVREEQYFLERLQKSSPSYDLGRTSAEEFEQGSPLSFSYLSLDFPRYAFRLYQLTEVYRNIDKITIRWMEDVYPQVVALDPERYLLSELVIHNWRNVFHKILREFPAASKEGNTEYELQISGIKWAAEPPEWREYLIKDIQKELPPQHLRLRRCLEERELLLKELFLNIERAVQIHNLENVGLRKRRGHQDQPTERHNSVPHDTPKIYSPPSPTHKPSEIPSKSFFTGLIEVMLISFRKKSPKLFLNHLAGSSTMLALYACFAAASALCIGFAVANTRPDGCAQTVLDDGFYTALSQVLLQLFSLYCIVVPLVRSQAVPAYRSWFWFSLALSAVSGVGSVISYPYSWKVSTTLGFASGMTQTIATIQLVEGLHQEAMRNNLGTAHLHPTK